MTEWSRRETGSGERFLVNSRLVEAGLHHVFTLRPTEDPARALAAAGIQPNHVARPRQVHGSDVARLDGSGELTTPAEADGVLVDRRGGAAAVATADCVGGILFAPRAAAFVVLHAGWRGILAGIVEASVASLTRATSAPTSEMLLATGPAVGGCCYEVGEDVERLFAALFTEARERAEIFGSNPGRRTLDPPAAVRILAGRAGLASEQIAHSGLCTMCRPDICWSWRVHGRAAGRMWTAAALPL